MRLFLISLIFFVALQVKAATYNATTANLIDINNAVALASNGDTVNVPAGTVTWSNTLVITKNIQIIGAGIGLTVITNYVLDGFAARGGGILIQWTTTVSEGIRLSGFTFTTRVGTTVYANGCVTLLGSNNAVRIDHIRWENIQSAAGWITEANFGVIDHCEIVNTNAGTPQIGFFMINGATGGGQANASYGGWGDYSYSTNCPMIYGTTNFFMYVETCSFIGSGEGRSTGSQILDAKSGSRMCYRYNMVTNCDFETHGTYGPERGGRAYEIYNNTVVYFGPYAGINSAFFLESGSGVIFSNAFTGWGSGAGLNNFQNYRASSGNDFSLYFEGASGLSAWDLNTNGLIYAGTHTGTNHSYFLEDTNSTWVTGQFANSSFHVLNMSLSGGTNTGSGSLIVTNMNKRIYHKPSAFAYIPAYQIWWTNGQIYNIRKTFRTLDQVGSGNGNLILDYNPSARSPSNTVTHTLGWPNQTIDPVYIWGNTLNGSPVNASENYGFIDTGTTADGNYNDIKLGTDYLNSTKPAYTPLVYPHPLVQSNAVVVTGNVTTFYIKRIDKPM